MKDKILKIIADTVYVFEGNLDINKPLDKQSDIDSLDCSEIELEIQDQFDLDFSFFVFLIKFKREERSGREKKKIEKIINHTGEKTILLLLIIILRLVLEHYCGLLLKNQQKKY